MLAAAGGLPCRKACVAGRVKGKNRRSRKKRLEVDELCLRVVFFISQFWPVC